MTPWTRRLWDECSPIYAEITSHPFVTGLVDGTLRPEQFGHYLAQDAHYLRDYARALLMVGAKAPTSADVALFARHATNTIEVELALRTATLAPAQAGGSVDPADRAGGGADPAACLPTTRAYTRHLLAAATDGAFADGLAAVLPCYLIYARLGADLVDRPIPDPQYRQWVQTYADKDFVEAVREISAVADRVGATLTPGAEQRARALFAASARYEWMFWDAAYRREQPVAAAADGTRR